MEIGYLVVLYYAVGSFLFAWEIYHKIDQRRQMKRLAELVDSIDKSRNDRNRQ